MGYRYFSTDLFTGALLADSLPLDVTSFGQRMNGVAGDLSGDLVLGSGAKLPDRDAVAAVTGRPVGLWADLDGSLVWGGICWDTDWTSGSPGRIPLKVKTFDSFLDVSEVRSGITYSSAELFVVMRDLVTRAQSLSGQNVGIQVDTGEVCGNINTLVLEAWETKMYGAVMREWAAQEGPLGFEWCLDVSYHPTTRRPRVVLRCKQPRLGSSGGATYEYPGTIVDYSWPNVFSAGANDIRAIGSGSEASTVFSSAQVDAAAISAGMVRIQRSTSYKDEDSVTVLGSRAAVDMRAMSGSVVLPSVTVRADAAPVFGTTRIGDDLRVRLTSERHPAGTRGEPGFDGSLRCVGWDLHPPRGESSAATVDLILAELPRYPRVPLPLGGTRTGSWQRDVDRRLKNLER